MRASFKILENTNPTSRLLVDSASKLGNEHLITRSILLFLFITLAACATKSAYTGHFATDLSAVKRGEPRNAIEQAIGQPEKVEEQDSALVAWYVIDRGYVGTLENNSAGEDFLPDDHPLVTNCAKSAVRGELGVCQGVRDRVRPSYLPDAALPTEPERAGD